ncbi:PASTA domain-containing protein [Dactylosporangium sp. NPDC000244]|uniref:PASTA domain-containing protein n=1 Tax=Dactylosporangium sp. NPDC000244 TaxID=3154365 RepID=UPI003327A87A
MANERDDESSTQPFWPFEGDQDDADPDATRIQRPDPDATQVRASDATQVGLPDAEPMRRVRPTARIVEETYADTERERWSARAGVPAPGDPALRPSAQPEWTEEEEDPYQGRSWLMPVVVGIVALVLVAALSVGLYLIYRATAEGRNAPGVVESNSASAAASPAPPPSSAPPPTSAPPSTEAPTSAPPGPVTIPPLRGNSLAEATVKLQALGLNVRVERTVDDSLPPGEVLSSRPGEGATVLAGETVTLSVAMAPPPSENPQPSVSASR